LRRSFGAAMLTFLLVAIAVAGPVDPSIGVCTRKDEFAKRQAALDPLVAALGRETKTSKKRGLEKKLVKAAAKDIECLMRYREPALVPVLAEVATSSKKWFVRTRALYALKMIGDRAAVPAAAKSLDDRDEMVREAAASALGAVKSGMDAHEAFGRGDVPAVLAMLDDSIAWREAEGNPYQPSGEAWVGPEAVLENLVPQTAEVDRHTFFHLREDGGTRISSAFKVCRAILETHYNPMEWNVYLFHFSDGDNSSEADSAFKALHAKQRGPGSFFRTTWDRRSSLPSEMPAQSCGFSI